MPSSSPSRRGLLLSLLVPLALVACSEDSPPPPAGPEALSTPAAADSSAPHLASDPEGGLVLSWLEPRGEGQALVYSRFEQGRWSQPSTVASGENWFVNYADTPSVVPITQDLWAAHWLSNRGQWGYAYDIELAISKDGGRSWSAPTVPERDDTDTQHGFATLFRNGNGVGIVWLDGRKTATEYNGDVAASAMTLRTATVSPDGHLSDEALIDDVTCDCCRTAVAYTSGGPVVVYRDRTVEEIRDIYIARRTDSTWEAGHPVHEDHWEIDGCPVNGPAVAASGTRVAVAWFTGAQNRARVEAAWSDDAGKTFAAPIEIDAERPRGQVGAVLLPDGDLAVSWLRSSGEHGAELCLRRVAASGTLGPVRVLEQATAVSPFSVPQLALAGDELIVAWTRQDDEDHTSVQSAVVPVGSLR